MEKMYAIYSKNIGTNVSSLICVSKTAEAAENYLNKQFTNCEFVRYSDINTDCLVKLRNLSGCVANRVSNDYLMQLTVLQIRATTTVHKHVLANSLLDSERILVLSNNKIVTRIFVDILIGDENGCFTD